jgi:preprotein translocase subunit SecD
MKTTLASLVTILTIAATGISATVRFSEVCAKGTPNSKSMQFENSGQTETLFIKDASIATDADIQSAASFKDNNGYGISITLFPESAKRFDDSIKNLRDQRLGIIIDDKLASAPTLRVTQFNGRLQITGNFSEETAKEVASSLNKKKTEQGAAANP